MKRRVFLFSRPIHSLSHCEERPHRRKAQRSAREKRNSWSLSSRNALGQAISHEQADLGERNTAPPHREKRGPENEIIFRLNRCQVFGHSWDRPRLAFWRAILLFGDQIGPSIQTFLRVFDTEVMGRVFIGSSRKFL
ncbi:hypothetical protein CEXT_255001 [Caerostris extrusa]|uniref:Uncharacterized protein n=1 Tax=Caerostris extrusa TaxID=172846 RepID=A0AAV4RW01_CAEEX|nr:hypothetical protein CEXT_255001 [Caerostris extrusa]